MAEIDIRMAQAGDAPAIAALTQGLAHLFTGDGVAGAPAPAPFLATVSEAAVSRYVADPAFFYLVALRGAELVGVAALRDDRHVYHLFVSPACRRQGLATRLWQRLKAHAIERGNGTALTVNSSLFAVPVYEQWGFVPTGPAKSKNGICFQPMRLPLPRRCPDNG